MSAPAISAAVGGGETGPIICATPTAARFEHDYKTITARLRAGETVIERCQSSIDSESLRCDLRFRCTPTERLFTVWTR